MLIIPNYVADNQNTSYSTDFTDGSQTLALTEDNMQVDSTNTSDGISVDVLDLKEGAILINSGNLLDDGQNVTHSTEATDCDATRAPKHANLRVNVPNTSKLSSSTTLDHNKVTLIPCTGEPVVGAHNVSYSTGLTDGNEISVHMQDNLIVEATPISECSSATTLDLNENAVAAYNGKDSMVAIHIIDCPFCCRFTRYVMQVALTTVLSLFTLVISKLCV